MKKCIALILAAVIFQFPVQTSFTAEPQHLLLSYIWANKIVEFSQMI